MDKLISLAKRRGFIYQGSEIYGGLAGTWDYGPLGVLLKENVKSLWLKMFRDERDDVYGLDASIIMNPKVWEASGHVAGFADPLVECAKCKRRFRADHIDGDKCPECGGKLGELSQFNLMFKTSVGAGNEATTTYLRPETAQGIFVNFKNVVDSFHPKLPFGIAQVGKAFRNEIAPRDFIFRVREMEQMEIEYFVKEKDWENAFEMWRKKMNEFAKALGVSDYHEREIPKDEIAHYSKKTIDFEFEYPFGRKELWGLAYRTDYDLRSHSASSGQALEYFDEESGERYTPHVIEPSLGVDRTILATLLSAYTEDSLGGEERVYLKLPKEIAPIRAAVFPLLKNKPELVEKAKEIYKMLKSEFGNIEFDDNGNIGKRYRRQDEVGTPYCITVDFDTLGENPELLDTVTVRDRDTGEQRRVKIEELKEVLK
jgi:glycyl-tRNA synthetase, dimeric type